MKLDSARFRNFAKFENFECKFYDGVTRLVGMNGSGKSTVGLRGLMACINGIAEGASGGRLLGERFRFVGKYGKSADVEYTFKDESTDSKFTIKNHITDASNKITIKSESDAPLNEDFLKNFLNVSLMSARAFCALSGREQAKLCGIDTSNFDLELKKRKSEATELNARLRAFGNIEEVAECVSIPIEEIKTRHEMTRRKLNEQYLENRKKNTLARAERERHCQEGAMAITDWRNEQDARRKMLADLRAALDTLEGYGYEGNEVSEFISSKPEPETTIPASLGMVPELILIDPEYPDDSELKAIDEELRQAYENNAEAAIYQEYRKRIGERDEVIKQIAENKEMQADCIKARNAYMAGHEFGFAGLTTDEEGSLLLNDRPINESYFSTGELEMIVAKLHAAQNPEFKCRFIDDFERIDDENQEKILKELLDAGFQIIVAEVGRSSEKDNVIVLSECAIANNQEERPALL